MSAERAFHTDGAENEKACREKLDSGIDRTMECAILVVDGDQRCQIIRSGAVNTLKAVAAYFESNPLLYGKPVQRLSNWSNVI